MTSKKISKTIVDNQSDQQPNDAMINRYKLPPITSVTTAEYDALLLEQIAQIEQMIQPTDSWRESSITAMLEQDIHKCWAVMDTTDDDDIKVVSYCIWSQVYEVVEILRIGTHPEHQRMGYAKGLIMALQRYMARGDLTPRLEKILLEVRADNDAAISLYEKMGFNVIHIRKNYYPASIISSSDISNPNISSPNISSPNISSPNISSPNISSPNISSPDVSDSVNPNKPSQEEATRQTMQVSCDALIMQYDNLREWAL